MEEEEQIPLRTTANQEVEEVLKEREVCSFSLPTCSTANQEEGEEGGRLLFTSPHLGIMATAVM